jgi:hypothetical protein
MHNIGTYANVGMGQPIHAPPEEFSSKYPLTETDSQRKYERIADSTSLTYQRFDVALCFVSPCEVFCNWSHAKVSAHGTDTLFTRYAACSAQAEGASCCLFFFIMYLKIEGTKRLVSWDKGESPAGSNKGY